MRITGLKFQKCHWALTLQFLRWIFWLAPAKCGACVTKLIIFCLIFLAICLYFVFLMVSAHKNNNKTTWSVYPKCLQRYCTGQPKSTILLQTYLMLCLLCFLSSWSVCFSMFNHYCPQTQTNLSRRVTPM